LPAEPAEGVVKFQSHHTSTELPTRAQAALPVLVAWRTILRGLSLVGQSERLYGGAAYGNVSARIPPYGVDPGRRAFVISGTETGGSVCASGSDMTVVRAYRFRENLVESEGPSPPSSEALTHAAIYDAAPDARFVLHVHSPEIWTRRKDLRLPTTSEAVAYGTVEMALEVRRLMRETSLRDRPVLAMGGHEDGVIAFGRTADEAGAALLQALAAAYSSAFERTDVLCIREP
jgi:ribulose-5-phosphate 4-epimerase/fuculose-1-phosphate aldolase